MIKRISKKVFQPNRRNEYRKILEFGLQHGYVLCSLYDWFVKYQDSEKKVLILRHDVDYDPEGAFRFYQTEKELGATSSFYFRWKTMKPSLMHKMHRDHFEVSLHYETLADYAKKHQLHHKSDITEEVIASCRKILSEEIDRFELRFFKIHSLCSHGDKRNRELRLPNHILVDEEFKNRHQILFETYDTAIQSKFDAYISDSSIYSNFAWKHAGSPYAMMEAEKQTICLLTHPIHWNQSFFKNIKMLYAIFADNR
jgi:hypothetical protein